MFKGPLSGAARVGYFTLSVLALAIGLVGIVTPVLPTTPFLLLATWAASRCSPRFRYWLMSHPQIEKAVESWRREGAIPTSAKWLAVIMLSISWTGLLSMRVPLGYLLSAAGLFLLLALFIVTRPAPSP